MFVSVCECLGGWGGHHNVKGPSGLASQSNEPFQKEGGETPSTGSLPQTHTHTQTHTERKGPDTMTTCPRREAEEESSDQQCLTFRH